MKNEKREDVKVGLFLVLFYFLTNTIPYFFSFRSTIYGDIIFAFSLLSILLVLYIYLKKKYYNSFRLIILFGLHLLVLPFIQVSIFKYNNSEFVFNSEFLEQKIILAKNELRKIDGADALKQIIFDQKFELLNQEIPDKYIGKIFNFENYSISIESTDWRLYNRPNDRKSPSKKENTINVINHIPKKISVDFFDNKKTITFQINNETFEKRINELINEFKELTKFIKDPILVVKSNDIWLDSVSGFLLGNVKPNSRLTQMIQLFQLFNLFLITLVVSELIISSGWITLQRK